MHRTKIIESRWRQYWWECQDCYDEGGPYETWEQAWDAAIAHDPSIIGEPK